MFNDRHTDANGVSCEEHLSERQLARRWGTSQRTLQRWRSEHYGPAFMRIGGSIRYRLRDVLAYEARVLSSGGER